MPRKSLTQFLVEQQREQCALPAQLRLLLEVVARACKRIGYTVNQAGTDGLLGDAGAINVQGEAQKRLDVMANEILLEANEWGGHLAAMASEEMDTIHPVPNRYPMGEYLMMFDPIDGSSNVDVALSVGTIFSVIEAPEGISGRNPTEADFLLPGRRQVAAGYALYGSQTLLVLSVGTGVYEFSLDRAMGSWELTGEKLRIPPGSREFAINISNRRHWSEPVRQYIDDCLAGKDGPLGHDYGMRWTGSMVADIHRILKRGGVFMYPWDNRNPDAAGKLRLLYEANPMGFLIEQAGGLAFEEDHPILEIQPRALHQRVGVTMGDRAEVERILGYFSA